MEIRLIRAGEEEACNRFHNRLYGENRLLSQWHWEFVENTYDRTPLPFACVKDNEQIVGTQAFIPIRMIDRDGVFWTAKSEATLVDPEYRGRRRFEEMYQVLFCYAEEHQFSYVWGFTPAIKAFTRLEFLVPGKTQQLFLPFSSRSATFILDKLAESRPGSRQNRVKATALRTAVAAARLVSAARNVLAGRKLPSGLEIRTMAEPDSQAGACCERFVRHWGGTTIYRDSHYLRWRLFNNPYVRSIVRAVYHENQLLGWTAFTLGDDGLGYLVDIFVGCDPSRYQPGSLVRLLLLEAVIGTRNMGATAIRGWRVNQHPFDQLVCREARRVGFYDFKRGNAVVLYNCSAGRSRARFHEFDDWYINRICTEGTLS